MLIQELKAIARSFLSAQAKGIVLVGRNEVKLQAAHRDLDAGGKVLPIAANILLQEEADGVFRQALDKFGHVDVLVNASGTMKAGPIGILTTEEWWENFVRLLQTPIDNSAGRMWVLTTPWDTRKSIFVSSLTCVTASSTSPAGKEQSSTSSA